MLSAGRPNWIESPSLVCAIVRPFMLAQLVGGSSFLRRHLKKLKRLDVQSVLLGLGHVALGDRIMPGAVAKVGYAHERVFAEVHPVTIPIVPVIDLGHPRHLAHSKGSTVGVREVR